MNQEDHDRWSHVIVSGIKRFQRLYSIDMLKVFILQKDDEELGYLLRRAIEDELRTHRGY